MSAQAASRAGVTVVGVDGTPPSPAAAAALAAARVVLGGRRQLDQVAALLAPAARRVQLTGELARGFAELGGDRPAVVLASGDPGFFGVVRALSAAVGPVAVVPATSSVARAFAAAGLPWDDAVVVSAHGRDPSRAVNACRRHPKVAVLTEPGFGPAELGAALTGTGRRLVVAERLGGPGERVTEATPEAAARARWAEPNVVLALDPAAPPPGRGWSFPARATPERWALDEAEFEHRDGMITRQEVRALALAWLGPGLGDLVWDVGAGSGSVAVECARLGAAAVAVEADAAQCARIRANARAHRAPVEVVEGRAPEALTGLPDPDTVFVGGGGDRLDAILAVAAARARRAVVVALAALERVGPARAALDAAGLDVRGGLLQSSRLVPVTGRGTATAAGAHRLAAANPVVLLCGRRR
jgi:precorrin-6Y C5,15-methyltransferase (decarboxylating)